MMRTVWLRAMPWRDILQLLAVAGLLGWALIRGAGGLEYHWQWYRVPRYIYTVVDGQWVAGPLLRGLWITLKITAVSLVLATAFGLVAATFRLSHSILARLVARLYVEVIRNTPLLVQLFFIYFVLAPVIGMGRFTAAILALSLFEGAYAAEIFRAGILSIHKGQWEAAYSLGFSRTATYFHVILPQAVRRVLPPLTSQAVSLIKDSALVSTISIFDLTMQGNAIVAETYLTFEIWLTVAAIYLVVTGSVSLSVRYMERKLRTENF